MSTNTANYNLIKAGLSDSADIRTSHNSNMDIIDTELKSLNDNKAPLASPALTGEPTAPTANSGTNTDQLATTAFVATAVVGMLKMKGTTTENADLNTYTTTGIYKLLGNACTNFPSYSTAPYLQHAILKVFTSGTATVQELTGTNITAYSGYVNIMYTRVTFDGSTWSDWKQVVTRTEEPSTKAANGYKKFADGIILQWGITSLTAATAKSVIFPVAFPTGCLIATANPNNSGGGATIGTYTLSTTGFYAYSTSTQSAYWFAIGY